MEKIILASQSPRRQEILSLGGYEYEVCVSSAEEQIPPEELENLTPQELVEKLARVKAEDVYRRNCSKNMEKSTTDNQAADSVEEITVIGADTVVAVDGRVLGKMAHAERRGRSVAVNIYGEQDMKIFESGVAYFQ